jgi:hypothetical protein
MGNKYAKRIKQDHESNAVRHMKKSPDAKKDKKKTKQETNIPPVLSSTSG